MKIAFLVGRFPSLSETFILNQMTGLIDAGHQVDIFASGRPSDKKVQPQVDRYNLLDLTHYFDIPAGKAHRALGALDLLRRDLAGLRPALDCKKLGREVYSLRLLYLLHPFLCNPAYDILHCHFGNIGRTGMLLKQMGVPGKLIVTFHGYDISQALTQKGLDLYTRLFKHIDLLTPVSEFWGKKLVKLGADPARVRVHRMGIDLSHFEFMRRAPGPNGEICLLTVGRLVEKKGIAQAIHALARARQRRPKVRLRYDIVGDGPLQGELEQLIAECGLRDVVTLVGPQTHDEIVRRMLSAHLFLLPSVTAQNGDQEGIPVSLMEAMATGMPILSTWHSGISELVQDGVSGYLSPERDVEALADRLVDLIDHPGLWEAMGRQGRAFVEQHHNIDLLNRDLEKMYLDLCKI